MQTSVTPGTRDSFGHLNLHWLHRTISARDRTNSIGGIGGGGGAAVAVVGVVGVGVVVGGVVHGVLALVR